MERKTITQLVNLRVGDRFTFLKRADIWQVMEKDGSHIYINMMAGNKPLNKYNEKKSPSTQVMFLRHTIPVSGEKCFVEDLQEGDVFWQLDNVVTEYVVINRGHDFYKVRQVADKEGKEPIMAGRLAQVVFVRQGSREVVKEGGQA